MHREGCKGRQVHLHTITTDGRIPFQLHFRSRGRKDPVVHITVAEANLAEMEGKMEKGSPLTLIWANNTAPAPDEHPRRKKRFPDERAALLVSDRRQ